MKVKKTTFPLTIVTISFLFIGYNAFAGTEGHSKGSQKGSHKGSHSSDLAAPKSFIPPKPYQLRKLYKKNKSILLLASFKML